MFSGKQVEDALNLAGADFDWCWNAVFKLQGRSKGLSAEDLYNFQPRLFDGLDRLSKAYRAVRQEEKRLISRKSVYNPKWFATRMRKLKKYRDVILEALAIGKSIGDGFVWMFYRDERYLIDKHLNEQRQKLIPGQIGGLGERIMVEKIKRMDDHLILSHAITSFLRLGDVSLYNLKTGKVTAIGEVKTSYLGNDQYNLSLSMVSGEVDGIPRPKVSAPIEDKGPPPLEPRLAQKLRQQMKAMGNALREAEKQKTASEESTISQEMKFHYSKLGRVIKQAEKAGIATIKADRGLLIVAIRNDGKPGLSERLMGKSQAIIRKLDSVPKAAISITSRKLEDNSMMIGSIGAGDIELCFSREGLPLVWWPLKKEDVRKILFREVMIVTLFNPAFLWRDLRDRGFTVESKHRGKVTVSRRIGDDAIDLENFDYYYRMVTHSLMSEQAVMRMVDQFLEVCEQKRREGYSRIDMVPRVILPPSNGESS